MMFSIFVITSLSCILLASYAGATVGFPWALRARNDIAGCRRRRRGGRRVNVYIVEWVRQWPRAQKSRTLATPVCSGPVRSDAGATLPGRSRWRRCRGRRERLRCQLPVAEAAPAQLRCHREHQKSSQDGTGFCCHESPPGPVWDPDFLLGGRTSASGVDVGERLSFGVTDDIVARDRLLAPAQLHASGGGTWRHVVRRAISSR
jgi:hypothetical protein